MKAKVLKMIPGTGCVGCVGCEIVVISRTGKKCCCADCNDGVSMIYVEESFTPATLLHPMGSMGEEVAA